MVGQQLYSQNFLVMETMTAVAFYYIFIVTVFDFLLKRLENYLDVTRRDTARPVDAEMQQLATARRPAMARSVSRARSRRCRPLSCIRPTTMSKCWGR